jgi:hypothetical protein
MAQKAPSSARTCIFCGGNKLSKEHFWSKWIDPLISSQFSFRYEANGVQIGRGKVIRTGYTERTGKPTSKRLRVVCKQCNNGWMSALEANAKRVLTPLILGKRTTLTASDQRSIATWVSLKSIISEHNIHDDEVTPQTARSAFRKNPQPLSGMIIWIGECGQGGWQSAFYRTKMCLGILPMHALPTESNRPATANSQSISFGIGRLFIHVSHTTIPQLNLKLKTGRAGVVRQIWPIVAQNIFWPPMQTLTAENAATIASTLNRILENPDVSVIDESTGG